MSLNGCLLLFGVSRRVQQLNLQSLFAFVVSGFTLSGMVKVLDFGLANILENSSPLTNEVYEMSGETGSVRVLRQHE